MALITIRIGSQEPRSGDWRAHKERALLELQRDKPETRVGAARALVELAQERDAAERAEFLELVPRLIGDKEERIRREGVALGALCLPAEEIESFLIRHLRDAAPDVRIEATGQLADLARPNARGALAAMLEDEHEIVRFEAARGMAALHHPAGLEVLVAALEDSTYRFRALGALAELGDMRALPAVQKIFRKFFLSAFERTQAAGAMAKLGDPEGGRHLLERTRKRWSTDRALAIELLGELKVEGARARLLEIIRDPKDLSRGAAARGLGRLGDTSVIDALVTLFNDQTAPEDVRLDAAEGLVLLKDPRARETVQNGLGSFTSKEARDEVQAMLEESGP